VKLRPVRFIYWGDDLVICTGNPERDAETGETEETEPPETDENGEPLESKPEVPYWIQKNDIIIVSGTGLESGKVIG